MIHCFKSCHLHILADHFSRLLDQSRGQDPFQPHTIIVPNLDTARWLKLFIAEKNGIAANLQFMLPAEWQWKQIRKLFPDLPEKLWSDIEPMKWTIFELLMNANERKAFPVLERYILSRGRENEETAILQLASQVASVFDQYLIYRPEMMLRWQNGSISKEQDESWQSQLWRKLCLSRNSIEIRENTMNKAELFTQTLHAMANGDIGIENALYCFNLGLIPKPILSLLHEAGKFSSVELFLIQPADRIQFPENELLDSFGGDAAQVQRLYEMMEGPKEYLSAGGYFPDTLLGHIRQSVTNNSPLKEYQTHKSPQTVQVRSCHSPLREVETLHRFLLEQFECDDTLRPDDILVTSPQLEDYAPFIRAVFDNPEEGQPTIPYHLAYNRSTNEIEHALNQLLTIADSRFYFAPVMDFFTMEAVRETCGVSESEAALVKRWMQENNVIWGLDAAHRAEFGQPGDSLQTWQTALNRGWLGQWIGETDELEEGIPLLYNGVQSVSQQENWAAFSHFMNLLDDLRKQSKNGRSIPDWCTWLKAILPQFFGDAFKTGTDGLRIMQLIDTLSQHVQLAGSISVVPFSLFRAEIKKQLEDSSAAGARFTGGITFSSMVPVRSIPFRVIALIGLNDQSFPRKPSTPDFDLMARQPFDGERNRKQEDRNLFLESVLAAQDVHYCSYIGQSPVDNETIPPSTIVSEWVEMISAATGLDDSKIIKKEALTGFSPNDFRNGGSFSKDYFMAAQAMQQQGNTVNGFETSKPLPEPEEKEKIAVSDLTRFFRNPVSGFMQKRLGVYFKEPENEKEEFETGHLETHILFQKVFGWMLSGKNDGEIRNLLSGAGILPSGWPGQKTMNDLLENAQTAIFTLREHEFEPEFDYLKISISLGNIIIEDDISTYSKNRLLDINPSGKSGRTFIETWIRHLCRLGSGGTGPSWLLCNLKKGEPELIRFDDPGNATEILTGFVQLYREGLLSPLHFFPNTLTEFSENDDSKRDHKARLAFEGAYLTYGERENIFVQTLLGPSAAFSHTFLEDRFLAITDAMIANKKEEG